MDRSHLLALCLVCSACAYGMDNTAVVGATVNQTAVVEPVVAQPTDIVESTPVTSPEKRTLVLPNIAHALIELFRHGQGKAALVRQYVATVVAQAQEKGQALMNNEHIKAINTYVCAHAHEVKTYAKENPVKTSLMIIGGSVVAGVAAAVAHEIRRAIRCYHADHDTFCCCCGKKINTDESKYCNEKELTTYGYYNRKDAWTCAHCNNYLNYHENQAHEARLRLRYQ